MTEKSVLQPLILSYHYFYMVCYVEVEILLEAVFNFVMVKTVTMCSCLYLGYSDVEDCMLWF